MPWSKHRCRAGWTHKKIATVAPPEGRQRLIVWSAGPQQAVGISTDIGILSIREMSSTWTSEMHCGIREFRRTMRSSGANSPLESHSSAWRFSAVISLACQCSLTMDGISCVHGFLYLCSNIMWSVLIIEKCHKQKHSIATNDQFILVTESQWQPSHGSRSIQTLLLLLRNTPLSLLFFVSSCPSTSATTSLSKSCTTR